MKLKDLTRKLYMFRFLDDFILVYPVYVLLFQNSGISPFQISVLLAIWSITTLILEVPTGIWADKYSRRNLIILGELIRALGYLFWLIGGNFWMFAIGFILWGAKGALTSGTFDAFVYDELKDIGKTDQYESIRGRIKASGFMGVALALVLGGVVAEISYVAVLILSVIGTLASAAVFASIDEVKITESTEEKKWLEFLGDVIRQGRNNKTLLYLMLFFSLIMGVFGSADEFFPLIYKDYGLSTSLVGIFSALMYVSLTLAGVSVGKISAKFKTSSGEVLFVGLAGTLITIVALFKTPIILVLLPVAGYFYGISEVRLEARLQHQIKSNQRATMLSINSLLFESIATVITLVIGYLSSKYGMQVILYLSGLTLITCATALSLRKLLLKEKANVKN